MNVETVVKLIPKYCSVIGKVMKHISSGQKNNFLDQYDGYHAY